MAVAGVGKRLEVSKEDRVELERIVRAASSEVRMVERARIVLCAAEGLTAAQIAERVGCGESRFVVLRVLPIERKRAGGTWHRWSFVRFVWCSFGALLVR
jgi:hypothetical protein